MMDDLSPKIASLPNVEADDDGGDEAKKEQALGRAIINSLFVLLRTAYIHKQNNDALLRPLEQIESKVNDILDFLQDNQFALRMASNTFFLNETLIKLDQSSYQNAEFLQVICEEMEIGAFELHDGCAEPNFRDLMISLVASIRQGPEGVEGLKRDLGPIQLKRPMKMGGGERSLLDRRQMILRTYAGALMYCNDTMEAWAKGKRPRPSELKRLVQGLVDIVNKDAVTLLGITQLRAYRKYLANHFVNTAIVALVIGKVAGLDRTELVRLGMTALLHELGAMDLPRQIIDRVDSLGEAEKQELVRLPYLSVLHLLEFKGFSMDAMARVVSVFENRAHLPAGDGYRSQTTPDAVAQMLSVADAYDHLTTSRLGNLAMRPDQALEQLLLNRENKFADWAVKMLAQGIGRYPIGTLVQLNTGERGVVFDRPADGVPGDQPQIRLIADKDGQPFGQGVFVDLSQQISTDPQRSIALTLDPELENVNVTHFFLD